jgi:hypothetical protein
VCQITIWGGDALGFKYEPFPCFKYFWLHLCKLKIYVYNINRKFVHFSPLYDRWSQPLKPFSWFFIHLLRWALWQTVANVPFYLGSHREGKKWAQKNDCSTPPCGHQQKQFSCGTDRGWIWFYFNVKRRFDFLQRLKGQIDHFKKWWRFIF